MRGKKRAVRVTWDNVVGGPRVVESRTLEADPTERRGLSDRLGSSLIVAAIVRAIGLGMKSIVFALAGGATSWFCGEFAAAEARSLDCHIYPKSINCSLMARLPFFELHMRWANRMFAYV